MTMAIVSAGNAHSSEGQMNEFECTEEEVSKYIDKSAYVRRSYNPSAIALTKAKNDSDAETGKEGYCPSLTDTDFMAGIDGWNEQLGELTMPSLAGLGSKLWGAFKDQACEFTKADYFVENAKESVANYYGSEIDAGADYLDVIGIDYSDVGGALTGEGSGADLIGFAAGKGIDGAYSYVKEGVDWDTSGSSESSEYFKGSIKEVQDDVLVNPND